MSTRERPILFNGPMVRAILDGRKTVTRRAIKPAFPPVVTDVFPYANAPGAWMPPSPCNPECPWEEQVRICPYGAPGDRLWVRETWSTLSIFDKIKPSDMDKDYAGTIRYLASGWRSGKLRPSIHMPRWACRILLEVTAVRVERLQDITYDQAMAEGIGHAGDGLFHVEDSRHLAADPRESFASLWESTGGANSWDANPWVWGVEFKLLEGHA